MTPFSARQRVIACAALVSMGCGQVAGEEPELENESSASGTRLKARLLRAPDGATMFQGWYDTELGIRCAFEAASDGEYRCLPEDTGTYAYSDAACGVPVRGFAQNQGPAYVLGDTESISDSTCFQTGLDPSYLRPVFMLDRELTGVVPHGYLDGSCQETSACSNPDVRLFDPEQKTEVPPERFARAELILEERSDRVGARTFVSEDGAREVRAAHNRESDMPCMGPEWGLELCLPQNVAYSEVIPWRSDPLCTHVVAHGHSLECPPAELILRSAGHFAACDGSVTLHEVGANVPSSSIYEPRVVRDPISGSVITSECVSDMGRHASDAFYEVGPEIGDGRFARLGYRTSGTGPIRTRFPIAPPSSRAVGHGWFVDENDEEVTVLRLNDGELHAITALAYQLDGSTVFSDPACRDEAAVVYSDPCTGAAREAVAYSMDECTGVTTLYSMSPQRGGGFELTETGCVPLTSLGEGAAVYARGEVIEPATYPLLQEVTE